MQNIVKFDIIMYIGNYTFNIGKINDKYYI